MDTYSCAYFNPCALNLNQTNYVTKFQRLRRLNLKINTRLIPLVQVIFGPRTPEKSLKFGAFSVAV